MGDVREGAKQFVFLICTERSGSNLITSLMNGHSRICGPPPSHLFRLFVTNRGNYGDLQNDANWNTFLEDVVLGFETKLARWSTQITAEELRSSVTSRGVAEALRFLYQREADGDGADLVFVKENHTHRFAPFLLSHFPSCRFVWMVRDPRDVASSWISTPGLPGGVAKAVEIWLDDQGGAAELFRELGADARALQLRYEDLVGAPERTLRRLTGFLELSFEEDMLESYKSPRTVANAERVAAWTNLGRPVLRNNTGKHRQVLSATERRYVELACYQSMSSFGYDCDLVTDLPEPSALRAELEALRAGFEPPDRTPPSAQEMERRSQRRAAIDRVLSRRLSDG